jgi:hypothetical protein
VTRILTLLDDILSSTSPRTKVPKKNVPRVGRYLISARCQNKKKKEDKGEEGEWEGEGGEDLKEGRERDDKLYNTFMNTTDTNGRIHCCRQDNNSEKEMSSREDELHPMVDPVMPMIAPDPLRASTLDPLEHPAEEHMLVPKQGGEDPVFRLNTVRFLVPYFV